MYFHCNENGQMYVCDFPWKGIQQNKEDNWQIECMILPCKQILQKKEENWQKYV